jgi:Ca2+-dependent lipid-binding protein
MNDIEAARGRLDKLYQIMEVDEIANALRDSGAPTADKVEQTNFLYSIKVVMAENLKPMDNNGLSDPYVVLEIDGKQIAKTRTVYETLNPRWDQIFDISLDNQTVEVLALVLDEDVLGADEDCGAAWFKLSPQYFDDYQTHEIVLNLDTQGQVVLRISMEGEKDDIQFWFGKAFRTLKRAENDTGRLIVERVRISSASGLAGERRWWIMGINI